MVTKQLSLTYLSQHIGIDNYNLLKNSFLEIAEDGHFVSRKTDKELAALLFENSKEEDFFSKSSNLIEFCLALPALTQKRIADDLGLDSIQKIKWNRKTSDVLISKYGLDSKFKFEEETQKHTASSIEVFAKPDSVFKKLKEYQSSLFFNVYNYISQTNYARCIIQMPTGSGKTRTAMELVCETINQTKRDVLWLANTEELCDQAFFSFNENWHFLRTIEARSINHIRIGNTTIERTQIPTFHVATLQSFGSDVIPKKTDGMDLDLESLELVIVDEAHISIAPTYKMTIEKLIESGAKLIGLTATPGRQIKGTNGVNENQELADFYFNKMFEIHTGENSPIDYLRTQGILSNAYFRSIEGTTINQILSRSELSKCIENNTIPKKIEAILTSDARRSAIIFDQLNSMLSEGKKILFFGTSILHSKLICSLVKLKGFSAAHVDGSSGKYRKQIINDFKEGNIQILCNYGVLSTGFDDPKIDVVFMARPTNSIVLYSQIIGRGLRGPLIGGTDTCEIYTVFDNILDLPSNNEIYEYFSEYFV